MLKLRQKSKTKVLAYMGATVALIAVLAQISFPLPVAVPISLGLLGVLVAGISLGPVYGTLSVGVYVILGLIGAPVFAGFRGGLGILSGATGGYIVGYIFAAACAGFFSYLYQNNLSLNIARAREDSTHLRREKSFTSKRFCFLNKAVLYLGLTAAVCVCYVFGTLWYSIISGLSFLKSLSLCVLPFILGDILKIIIAGFLQSALQRTIKG